MWKRFWGFVCFSVYTTLKLTHNVKDLIVFVPAHYYYYFYHNGWNCCELEWTTNTKLGPITGNDANVLSKKCEPNQPEKKSSMMNFPLFWFFFLLKISNMNRTCWILNVLTPKTGKEHCQTKTHISIKNKTWPPSTQKLRKTAITHQSL